MSIESLTVPFRRREKFKAIGQVKKREGRKGSEWKTQGSTSELIGKRAGAVEDPLGSSVREPLSCVLKPIKTVRKP